MGNIALAVPGLLGWIYALSPRWVREFFAWGLGRALFVFGFRKKVVIENMRRAFPGEDPESVQFRKTLLHRHYHHLGHLFLQLTMLFGALRYFVDRNVDFEGREHMDSAREQGRGIIYLSCHVGNWEVMAAGACRRGADALLVTKHLKPEFLHQAVIQGRLSCGVEGTYEPRTMRDVLARLRSGRSVGMVLDQYAGPPIGVRVPLFGVPVGTSTGLAAIAKRTAATIVPVVSFRRDDGRTTVRMFPPILWQEDADPHRELAINTARYVEFIERQIRAYPEQWLWTHRRFKGNLGPLLPEEWSQPRSRTT